jgi:mono/diheme cytochrome c family protein
MKPRIFLPLLPALLPVAALAADDAEALFVRRIQPLIAEKCVACHGKDSEKIKAGYDMRTREGFFKGGESGEPAVVAGQPEKSPAYLSVLREHDDWEPMPPKEADKLYAEQIGWIKAWIAGGAPWPDEARQKAIAKENAEKWSAEDGTEMKTSGGLSADWTHRKYPPEGMWGYRPLRVVDRGLGMGEHPIDQFLAQKMPEGVKPAPPADARTFIRRGTFDLTGLPPTPEEVAAFEADFIRHPPSAIGNLLDRLLASPHYGERMAQHWLDVTRYADSSGFANDYERGNAWRYRDYVVRAFNSDKPYDQFIREQIAGDEIDPANPEMLVATGFLRMGPWELTGMEVAKIARQRFLDDVTNAIGETFLAHSLQCARCHDHKFDPVPTRDYYAIQAVFATTQLTERPAPFLPVENTAGFEERQYLEAHFAAHMARLRELDAKMLVNAEQWFAEKKLDRTAWDAAVASARTFVSGGGKAKKSRSFTGIFEVARNSMQKQGVPEDRYPPKLVGFTPEDYGNERVARKGLERLRWELERYEPFAFAVYNGRTPQMTAVYQPLRVPPDRMTQGDLEETCVLTGGDPFGAGAKVQPGVLSILDAQLPPSDFPLPTSIDGRRKAFAEWVASPRNPLTTRAIVNRIWLWHFSQPLAGNPNNFGSTGKKPTHPELLDWLAAEFVKQGWSFKAMHRLIMTSRAYQRGASVRYSVVSGQSGASAPSEKLNADALNAEYLGFPARRLSAEELRDAMLAATGELNRTVGGIPNRPEINLEAALQPRQVMGTFAAAWVPNPRPEQRHRRSLYALKLRGLTDPMLEVFNAPAPDFSCERREASTVTPQVFSLFNGQSSHARALALAHGATKETQSEEAAIIRCFQLALSRPPRAEELQSCLTHWREITAMIGDAALPSPKPPLEVRRDAVEENTGEKFSFQEKLHAYADFVPDLQPTDVPPKTRALADVCLALLNSNEFAYVY